MMRTFVLCALLSAATWAAAQPAEAAPPPNAGTVDQALSERAGLDEFLRGAGDVISAATDLYASTNAPAAPLKLDVRECVRIAVEKNPQALAAQDEVDAANARIRQARSNMLPHVSASIAGTATDYNTHSNILTDAISAGAQPKDQLLTEGVTISQTLFAGGQILAATRASTYLAKSQEWKRAAALDGLELDAKKAYYDAILSAALVRVAEDSVKTFERNRQDAEHMFDAGVISNFEVLRARTELGARQADAVAARNGERLARANLLRLLALPQDTPIAIEPKLEWTPALPAKEELNAYANAHRPELLALDQGIEAAKQNVRRARGEYLPQVAAKGQYSNTDGGRSAMPDGWTVSLGAQWDLVTGGKRRGDVMEAEAQLRGLEHQRQDLENLIDLDISQSVIQVQDAIAKVKSERNNVDLAKEGLRLSELRFKEGVGTQTETLQAELALTSAETKLVQALRDYAAGQAALERATGKSWMRTEDLAKTEAPVINVK